MLGQLKWALTGWIKLFITALKVKPNIKKKKYEQNYIRINNSILHIIPLYKKIISVTIK